MDSIKTKTLHAVKAQILANANLRTNFKACVTLFENFTAQERSANGNEQQIAVPNVTGSSGSNPYDTYVPDLEWQAMPKDEKIKIKAAGAKIKAARKAKKTGGGGGGGNGKKKGGALKKSKQFKWTRKEFK